MSQDLTVEAKLGKAKAHLVLEQPFWATLIMNMSLHEDRGLSPPTLATDGKRIWYHPDFIAPLSLEQTKWCLCHEVGHAVFQHMHRRGDRNPRKWNVAGDYIINQLLEDEKIGVRVEGVYFNPQLVQAGGGNTVGVYDLLPDSECGGGAGDGQGGGAWDECKDAGGTPEEIAQAEAEMRVAVAQAAQAARMQGKLSTAMEQFVDAALNPAVDWRDVLRRFVSARAKTHYSYARPKRRFISEDLYLPSLDGEALGQILIAVDQSGSVSMEEVAAFKTEIVSIWQDLKPEKIHVYYFDSEVKRTESYTPDEEPDIRRYACGGTAFSPIFAQAEAEGIDSDLACCVVLTDLCCSDFGPPPPYATLWVTTLSTQAPWGQVVEMHPKGL